MFRKKKSRSANSKRNSELQFKKKSIILSNYLQSSFNSTNLDSELIPKEIVDFIINYLDFLDLLNFSLINRATYEYVQHQQTILWQNYLQLAELYNLSDYEKLKAKHSHLTESDFFRLNSNIIVSDQGNNGTKGSKKLNPLYIYPNIVTLDGKHQSLQFIYNPKLYKLQFRLIYNSLFPLYNQLISSNLQFNNTVFIKNFNNPIYQSILLNNFLKFSKFQVYQIDSKKFNLNLQNLQSVIEFFENACLREIEIGYDSKDFNNKVNYYTNVLLNLNDNLINNNLVNFFLQKLNLNDLIIDNVDRYFIITGKSNESGDSLPDEDAVYQINKPALFDYFDRLANILNNQINIIDQIFNDDKIQLILKIFEEIIQNYILEFVNLLLQKARTLNVINESIIFANHDISSGKFLANDTNLAINLLPLFYSNLLNLVNNKIVSSKNGGVFFKANLINLMNLYLENSISEYLSEELAYFSKVTEFNVRNWDDQTKSEENKLEQEILKNVKVSTDVNNKNSFLKIDLVTGFKNILKPINVTFEGMMGTSNATTNGNAADSNVDPDLTINNEKDEKMLTEFEAQLAIMNNKLIRIKSFFSLDLSMNIMNNARASLQRISLFIGEINKLQEDNESALDLDYNRNILKNCKKEIQEIFIQILEILGEKHVKKGFEKAIFRLKDYNPDDSSSSKNNTINTSTLNSSTFNLLNPNDSNNNNNNQQELNVQPLVIFTELVNIGDLIQNLIEVFYKEELINKKIINKNQDFLSKVLQSKKKFELMLDDNVANGLNIGIDVLVDKIQYIYDNYQDPKDFLPDPSNKNIKVGVVTECAKKTIDLLANHVSLLVGSTEKSTIDVFQQEVSQRFFALIVKNLKTLKINTTGALTLICDFNYYYDFIVTLRQKQILPYFIGLKTVGQIYLIDGSDAKLIGKTISDLNRFNGIFQQEEIYELVQCRADWIKVKKEVEKEMFGMLECIIV